MSVSAKTNYACKAILALALHWPKENPMRITDIAKQQKIPLKFLTQILLVLKQLGLVESTRGKAGGYRLIKNPKDIKLFDIVNGFDDLKFSGTGHFVEKNNVMEKIWIGIDQDVNRALKAVDFQHILQQQKNMLNAMSFDI